MKVFNATRHKQSNLKATWEKMGVEWTPNDDSQMPPIPPQASVAHLNSAAEDVARRARLSGAEAVMIGGLTGLSVLVAIAARKDSIKVIEPMVRRLNSRGLPEVVGLRDFSDAIDEALGWDANVIWEKR